MVTPGLHNYGGVITAFSIGPGPRNAAVNLWDGTIVVVPCGNLFDWNRKFKVDNKRVHRTEDRR